MSLVRRRIRTRELDGRVMTRQRGCAARRGDPVFFLIGDMSDDKSARTVGRGLYGGYLGSAQHA